MSAAPEPVLRPKALVSCSGGHREWTSKCPLALGFQLAQPRSALCRSPAHVLLAGEAVQHCRLLLEKGGKDFRLKVELGGLVL